MRWLKAKRALNHEFRFWLDETLIGLNVYQVFYSKRQSLGNAIPKYLPIPCNLLAINERGM